MMRSFFVSYAPENRAKAFALIDGLRQSGYYVVCRESESEPKCDELPLVQATYYNVFIAFLTADYLRSSGCIEELKYARKSEKECILVYDEELVLPDDLQKIVTGMQQIHKYAGSSEAEFYEELYRVVKQKEIEAENLFHISEQQLKEQELREKSIREEMRRSDEQFQAMEAKRQAEQELLRQKELLLAAEQECNSKKGFFAGLFGKKDRPDKKQGGLTGRKQPVPCMTQVEFSALAPKKFAKGEYSMVTIVMYEEAYRQVVEKMKAEAEEAVNETRSGLLPVAKKSMVRVVLASPDLELDDNAEEREWNGGYVNFGFAVQVPKEYAKKQILFQAQVYVNNIIATRLKFVVNCTSFREQKAAVARQDILSAFVSYASQDRKKVATIIQGMQKARPDMDIFFDVESLRSGDDWEHILWEEIEKRDVLFLCWSRYARESKWVDAEWRYAMENKGVDCIEPVPMEPPAVCPPPKELMQKHFNDRMLYIVNAEQG